MYYNGKMDPQTLQDKGWDPDPFNGLKILKGEMDYYYDSDPEISKSEDRIVALKAQIDSLTDILNMIKWRHSTIKNMIDYRRFELVDNKIRIRMKDYSHFMVEAILLKRTS